jgi:pyruvate dehydrogenase E1 component alpha subunit
MAQLWQLPLLVVVENNGIAQSTSTHLQMAGTVASRAQAFGVTHRCLTSVDVNSLRRELACVVAQVRERQRPAVVEFVTHRVGPHSKGDDTRPQQALRRAAAGDWYQRYGRDYPEQFARADDEQRRRVAEVVREVESRPQSRWDDR